MGNHPEVGEKYIHIPSGEEMMITQVEHDLVYVESEDLGEFPEPLEHFHGEYKKLA